MKMISLVMLAAFAVTASAGALEDKRIEKLLASEKIGQGMVYKNGRKVLRKTRECTLLKADWATESFERDVLVIGFTGSPIALNNFGVYPRGHYFGAGEKVFTEAGVFYDPVARQRRLEVEGGYGWGVYLEESDSAFARPGSPEEYMQKMEIRVTAKMVEMIDEYKGKTIKSVCLF